MKNNSRYSSTPSELTNTAKVSITAITSALEATMSGFAVKLVALGYMETFERKYLPYYNCTVTEAGKAAMLEQSPKPPKLTRGQKRYRRFLDADTGESFGEWLKWHGKRREEQV